MALVDGMLWELEEEAVTTRRVLERVPDNRLGWLGSRSGDQATHPDRDLGAALPVVCCNLEHPIPAQGGRGRHADRLQAHGPGIHRGGASNGRGERLEVFARARAPRGGIPRPRDVRRTSTHKETEQ